MKYPVVLPSLLSLLVAVPLLAVSVEAGAEGLKVEGPGLSTRNPAPVWPRWQARLGVGLAGASSVDAFGVSTETEAPRSAAVLGDYYFTGSGFDPLRVGGGFRATTGWLYGSSLALGAGGASTGGTLSASLWRGGADDLRLRHAGYIGIGYTGLLLKQGLGFSADLGLVGTPLTTTAPRLDSDYTIRDIRLAPTVRLGVSYAF